MVSFCELNTYLPHLMTPNGKNISHPTQPLARRRPMQIGQVGLITWVSFTQKLKDNITVFCLLSWNRDKKWERPGARSGEGGEGGWHKAGNKRDKSSHHSFTEGLSCCPSPSPQNKPATTAISVFYPEGHSPLSGNWADKLLPTSGITEQTKLLQRAKL